MDQPVLKVENLRVCYRRRNGLRFWAPQTICAVDGVSFTLDRGKILGIVGESGSGKSSLIKAIGHFVPVASGSVFIDGDEVTNLRGRQYAPYCRRLQIIPQDFSDTLDPKMSVEEILAEPLLLYFQLTPKEQKQRIRELLNAVELDETLLDRYPSQLSGGQRQRISIARGLAVDPEVLICDEIVSACDLFAQKQILNLLSDLSRKRNLSVLFIAHNIAVVAHLCHEIIVMRRGRFLEFGTKKEICCRPEHPYTRLLIDSVPRI